MAVAGHSKIINMAVLGIKRSFVVTIFYLLQFRMFFVEKLFPFLFQNRFELVFDKITYKTIQLIHKAIIRYTLSHGRVSPLSIYSQFGGYPTSFFVSNNLHKLFYVIFSIYFFSLYVIMI